MKPEHIRLFVRIAATRNISLAGRELGISPAVASNHINKLEEGLGVRLIHRSTRSVSLTEEGRVFLPFAEDVLASVESARASVGVGNRSPGGTLRVTAPASFGRLHLMPAISGFLSQYPELSLDLRLSDSIVDLVEGGFDVAIRNANLKDSSLIARKLAPDKRILCASPAYLERHGHPGSPKDLQKHQCLTLMDLEQWAFVTPHGQMNIRAQGRFRTDNGDALREACCEGLGIAINATWSAWRDLQQGRLVPVLEDFPLAEQAAIWAIYPSSRQFAPKVRAFIDYFAALYGDPPYWDEIRAC